MQVSTGTFTITGGTGRYRNAIGGGTFRIDNDKRAQPWVATICI